MDEIFDRIKEILERYVKGQRGFKAVYYGDPGAIPSMSLPALYVAPVKTSLVALSTGSDRILYTISVGAVYQQVTTYDTQPYDEQSLTRELVKAFLEADGDGALRTDTIVGAMRSEIQADDAVLFTDRFEIDYGMSDRRGFSSIEGLVTFEATIQKTRP